MALVITRKLGAGLYIGESKLVLTEIDSYSRATFVVVSGGEKFPITITDESWYELCQSVRLKLGKPFQRKAPYMQVKLVIEAPKHIPIDREERYNAKLSQL